MALIPGYSMELHTLEHETAPTTWKPGSWVAHCKENGGFDSQNRIYYKLRPDAPWPYQIFDAVTAVVEAGYADDEAWPAQLFGSMEAFDQFIQEIRDYWECYRIKDRWYAAFMKLAFGGFGDEEDFVLNEEIADALLESASKCRMPN